MVLRFGGQAVEQLGGGDALVWLEALALPHVDQRIGFFCARRHNATGAVVFEGSAHQHLVICQQGRGQCVALVAAKGFAVEGEGCGGGSV